MPPTGTGKSLIIWDYNTAVNVVRVERRGLAEMGFYEMSSFSSKLDGGHRLIPRLIILSCHLRFNVLLFLNEFEL